MSQIVKPLQFVEVIILLVVAVLAWPISVACNAPFQTCTPPPNEKGEIIRPVTIEPYAVVLLEKWLHTDLNISYKTTTAIDRPVLLPQPTTATNSATENPPDLTDNPEVENTIDQQEK